MSILIVSIAIKLKELGAFAPCPAVEVLTRLVVTNVRVCDSCEQLGGEGGVKKHPKWMLKDPFFLTVCSEVKYSGGIYEIGP